MKGKVAWRVRDALTIVIVKCDNGGWNPLCMRLPNAASSICL